MSLDCEQTLSEKTCQSFSNDFTDIRVTESSENNYCRPRKIKVTATAPKISEISQLETIDNDSRMTWYLPSVSIQKVKHAIAKN